MRTILPLGLLALLVVPNTFLGQEIRVLVSNVPGAEANHPTVGQGYLVRPAPHVDLNVIWDATSQTFRGGFRTDDEWINGVKQPPTQYEADQAIVFLPQSGRSQVLEGDPTFFGSLGDDVWILPSSGGESAATLTPYVGFSAYGVLNNGTFTSSGTSGTGRIFWSVHSVENLSNPVSHQFYGYNDSLALRLAPPGYQPSAELTMLANGHSHLNLLFQGPGMYRVTFRVRGTLAATGQEVSSLIPVYFGVENWQIPSGPVPATGYEAWKLALFSSTQAADPLVSGLDADPDGDGDNNLVEYAFNGNPLIPGVAGKPQMENLTDGGQEYLAIRYQRRKGDSTLSTMVESTADLSAVTWSGVGVQMGTGTAVGADYEEVVYRAPISKADAPKQFMRVRVLKE
jgi:surface-anchored protein